MSSARTITGFRSLSAKLWQHKSALVLILANLVPLFGVLFAGWSAFDVVYIYWLENVIIGGFNVCKMLSFPLIATPDLSTGEPSSKPISWQGRLTLLVMMLFMAAFFSFHYGMFTYCHGVFVLGFMKFGPGNAGPDNSFDVLKYALEAIRGDLKIPFLALVASHGFSFVYNWLVRGEINRVKPNDLMGAPYARVIVMHVTVIFGGMLSLLLPAFMAVLLVALKTLVDVHYHVKEREQGAIGITKVFARSPR